MPRHATQRPGASRVIVARRSPGAGSCLRISRNRRQRRFRRLHFRGRCVGGLEVGDTLGGCRLVGSQRRRNVLQLGREVVRPGLEDRLDLLLLRIVDQLLLDIGDGLELLAVGGLRDRGTGLLHAEPDHRDHVGDDQDDVLRHLRPGDRSHSAQERTHQDAGQAEEDPDLEGQSGEPRGDDAHAHDLRHHIGERTEDGGEDADQPRQVALVAGAEEVRDGELPELAQVRRQEERDQAIAAGPAHDEGEAAVAGQVERPRHADERRRAHPVGAGGHAVVHRRHTTTGDVVLRGFGRAAHDADAGVEADGGQQEDDPDPGSRQAHLLEHRQHDHEDDEAADVPAIDLVQLLLERRIVRCGVAGLAGAKDACHYFIPLRRRRILRPGGSWSARSTRS